MVVAHFAPHRLFLHKVFTNRFGCSYLIPGFVPIWGTLRINPKSFQIVTPLQVPGPRVLFEATIDNCKWCLRIRSLLDGARHRTTIHRSHAPRRVQSDWMGKQIHDSLSPKTLTSHTLNPQPVKFTFFRECKLWRSTNINRHSKLELPETMSWEHRVLYPTLTFSVF